MIEISAERFHLWKQDPVTLALFEELKRIKEVSKQEIFSCIRESDSALMQREYLGAMDMIDLVLNIEFNNLQLPTDEEKENVNIV